RQIVRRIRESSAGQKLAVLAPVVKGRKGEYSRLFEKFQKKGFLRFRLDGRFRELGEPVRLEKTKKHNIEVLVDEVPVSRENGGRLAEAVEKALEISSGDLLVIRPDGEEVFFSLRLLCPFCEVSLPELEPRSFSFNSPYGACPRCHGLGFQTVLNEWGEVELTADVCPQCRGARLKKESLGVKIAGKNIHELTELPVDRLIRTIESFRFSGGAAVIASKIQKEILSRLEIMVELGMPYLQLSRTTGSLSGGEAQRVRLAAQVGARLRGVLYVLDEPTVGLHQRDNGRLIRLLRGIRDEGNSVIVVEHDEQTIRAADHILDLGPGAGEDGGHKVTEGSLDQILKASGSLTSQYLRGEKMIPVPLQRRAPRGWLTVVKAKEHNLKGLDVRIPLGTMTAVTGVSGSGKSTLVHDILYKSLLNLIYNARQKAGAHEAILGVDAIDRVIAVDQKPIGRTPRSNPATYTGLLTPLRELFSRTPEARMRGYTSSRFSFNLAGGRCGECEGAGAKKVEMHFLPDVLVTCDRCGGTRYNKETLAVLYKNRSIADFLAMTVEEAFEYLRAHPLLKRKLAALRSVGLGYIRLGQPAPTLSGGEAQRIKLTKELGRKNTGRTLFLLDEPTTGLHFDDVRKLLELLSELVNRGNTVVVIEHNLEVIKVCDHVIDLGPEGGEEGGWIVAQGTPEDVAAEDASHTGQFLKRVLRLEEGTGGL
ncbi:MAG: excinuclease ABC subunit UvrA, partial [Candidatus Aminicenantes bacterium]|nr:excinuclease ABC subunit UvrA [Candidatus Aminicenantes bacterium]